MLEISFVFSLMTSLQGLAYDAYGTTAILTGFDPSLLYLHATAGMVNDFADLAILVCGKGISCGAKGGQTVNICVLLTRLRQSQTLPITAVIPDYAGPVLLSFYLDVSSWQLQLYFNEAVRPTTLDSSKVK